MNRRAFLAKAGAVGAFALSSAGRAVARKQQRTNFVIVLCDDLGYGDLGCYNHPRIRTPHLDRFAEEGMRLTDCYASAPVCSPSRCGMLSGRHPHRYGVYDWIPEGSPMHLPKSEVTVATLLRDAGYTTCHAGKWHANGLFNSPEQPQPGDHGFEHWFSTQNNALPSHRNPVNFVRNGTPAGPLESYSSSLIVEEAIRWLETLDGERPFCVFVWFHAPHEPIASGEAYCRMYPDTETPQQAEYFANVTQMDYEFGRLMETLDRLGHRDDTFVLFTSDNGPETLKRYRGAERSYGSPGRLRGMKLHMYEGGIRIPGVLRWPGRIRSGTTSDEPVSNLDVLPTLCALADVSIPENRPLDGANIAPAFENEPVRRPRPLYWRYDRAISDPTAALRDGRWKILADAKLERFEVYDLKEDPGESHDLAGERPERLASLSSALKTIHAEIDAEGPRWPEPPKREPRRK